MIKVIIAGGRDFSDYPYLCKVMDNTLRLRTIGEVTIVCGMARGADLLGLRYAKERGYDWLEFPADWDKYKKAAGYRRNVEMAEVSTHLVAFWNGKVKELLIWWT